MTIGNINIDATLEKAAKLIAEDKDLSPATKSLLEILVLIISLLANRPNLNGTLPERGDKSSTVRGEHKGSLCLHVTISIDPL